MPAYFMIPELDKKKEMAEAQPGTAGNDAVVSAFVMSIIPVTRFR